MTAQSTSIYDNASSSTAIEVQSIRKNIEQIASSIDRENVIQCKRAQNALHNDILLTIFSFLMPKDLCNAACVSKQWKVVATKHTLWNAFSVRNLFPFVKELDTANSLYSHIPHDHFGYTLQKPPIFNNYFLYKILNRLSPHNRESRPAPLYETALPKEIAVHIFPQGLTLNMLLKATDYLINTSSDLQNIRIHETWYEIAKAYGNNPIERYYKVVREGYLLRILDGIDHEFIYNPESIFPEGISISTLAIITYISWREKLEDPVPNTLYKVIVDTFQDKFVDLHADR